MIALKYRSHASATVTCWGKIHLKLLDPQRCFNLVRVKTAFLLAESEWVISKNSKAGNCPPKNPNNGTVCSWQYHNSMVWAFSQKMLNLSFFYLNELWMSYNQKSMQVISSKQFVLHFLCPNVNHKGQAKVRRNLCSFAPVKCQWMNNQTYM